MKYIKYMVWVALVIGVGGLFLAVTINSAYAEHERQVVEQPYPYWENDTGIEIQNVYGSDGNVDSQLNTYTAPATGYRYQEIIVDPYNTDD